MPTAAPVQARADQRRGSASELRAVRLALDPLPGADVPAAHRSRAGLFRRGAARFGWTELTGSRSLMIAQHNCLLASLPKTDFERLQLHLKPVSLSLGNALYESGLLSRHVYFPIDSIVPLLYVLEDGVSAEIAVVGNDGVVGVSPPYGRRNHAKPGCGSERAPRLPALARKLRALSDRRRRLLP